MSMSRQHFEAIAAALRSSKPPALPADAGPEQQERFYGAYIAWRLTALSVRQAVAPFNANFDVNRFDLAAGIAGKAE